MYVEDRGTLRRLAARIDRHRKWLSSEGVSRLVEEDDLNPRARLSRSIQRRRWLARNGGQPGEATPVYVAGVQRSGTNMFVRSLGAAPEVEVHGENDSEVFNRFQLRPDADVVRVIARSRSRFVILKPICDSHRVDELLTLPGLRPGRALWVYRDVDSRAASAVAKFGDVNLRAMADIASGVGLDRWQAQRLSSESLEFLRSFDYATLTPESGAALFWYVRNRLFFETGLAARDDVALVSYCALLADPAEMMQDVCRFLGLEYRDAMVADIGGDRRAPAPRKLAIHPAIRDRCEELREELDEAFRAQHAPEQG